MWDPKTIDPDNIPADTEVALKLPQVILAADYHEFGLKQTELRALGLAVFVDEVCFSEDNRSYVGLIHTGRPSDSELMNALAAYYTASVAV